MNPLPSTSNLDSAPPEAASSRAFDFDLAAVDADTADEARLGLALGSLAQLAYEKDPAVVERTLADAGARLVTGFLNPFGRKGAQGLAVETGKRLVLAFRGTDEPVDWLRNLRLAPSRWWGIYPRSVHKGFASALSMVWSQSVAKVLERAHDKPVIFAGHSLGGALALLAASRFEEGTVKWIHTFGQPLTGTPPFCKLLAGCFEGKYVRWVNHDDVVARVPPEPLYAHMGILKHFDADGNLLPPVAESPPGHRLRPMTKAEFEAFREMLRRPRNGREGLRTPPPGVADHSLANGYLPKLRRLVRG